VDLFPWLEEAALGEVGATLGGLREICSATDGELRDPERAWMRRGAAGEGRQASELETTARGEGRQAMPGGGTWQSRVGKQCGDVRVLLAQVGKRTNVLGFAMERVGKGRRLNVRQCARCRSFLTRC
jgi:hypothetical protein